MRLGVNPGFHRWLPALLLVGTAGCRAPSTPIASEPSALPAAAAKSVAAAEATPHDATRQRRAGTELIDVALEGRLELVDDAEHYLERALRLQPHDLTAARKLSRLLNLRLVRGDFSRAARQLQLFDLLRRESSDPYERFVFDCFHQMAQAAAYRRDGRPLAALSEVQRLEARLRRRMETHPDEVETAAMAGNYALAFAGSLPAGKRRRLDDATDYFAVQQRHWTAQSVTARGVGTAPGTRSVFAYWLAQAELARGRPQRARRAFEIVQAEGSRDDATVAMRQLASWAAQQAETGADPAGGDQLLPAWPHAEYSCIACHSVGSALPDPSQVRRRGGRRLGPTP